MKLNRMFMKLRHGACRIIVGALAMAACGIPAAPAVAEQAKGLAGTEWRLVEFQSMDDASGTKRPSDPSKYTMKLNADGTVAFVLNCNRANGKWSAEPGQDSSSGKFQFGPLAMTRALCPPPSMDELIGAQASYVRSYLLKDGRLHLSLMADGGIIVWEPATKTNAAMKPDAELEKAILKATPMYKKAEADGPNGSGRASYAYARVDLNGDGRDEVLVYLMGSIFCGSGGCTLQVFSHGPKGYSLMKSLATSRLPVVVSQKKSSGWRDLWKYQSGGGAPPSHARYAFNGKRYVERETVAGDKALQGETLLAGEITLANGIPLVPRN